MTWEFSVRYPMRERWSWHGMISFVQAEPPIETYTVQGNYYDAYYRWRDFLSHELEQRKSCV